MTDENTHITEELVCDLKEALTPGPGEHLEDILRRQALVLDRAFRRLLSDADKRIEYYSGKIGDFRKDADQYQLALRAQNQCQATAKTIGALQYMDRLTAPPPQISDQSEEM